MRSSALCPLATARLRLRRPTTPLLHDPKPAFTDALTRILARNHRQFEWTRASSSRTHESCGFHPNEAAADEQLQESRMPAAGYMNGIHESHIDATIPFRKLLHACAKAFTF